MQERLQESIKKKLDTPLTKLRQEKSDQEKITSIQAATLIIKKDHNKREIQIEPEKREIQKEPKKLKIELEKKRNTKRA